MAAAVVREIQAVDPEMPAFDVASMEQRLSDSLARRRFSMLLLGLFAIIALTLGAIGLYGVMAYTVNRQRHEFGVRVALGARPRDVLGLVIRHGMKLTLAGVAVGWLAAFGLTHLMSRLLFGVGTTDPATFIGIALLQTAVALAACWIPARRAARVDPMAALRSE
jgi:ABC-type antimicrobial peptide transport system permease subunit